MHPKTRREDVVVRELEEETLIYVPESNEAHCLNKPAALVWRHCDGQTSKSDLARMLSRELGVALDARVVDAALDELAKAKLLLAGTPRTPRGYSRRDALAKLGVSLAALPAVMSVVAPEAKAQASPAATIINNTTIIDESETTTVNTQINDIDIDGDNVGSPINQSNQQ